MRKLFFALFLIVAVRPDVFAQATWGGLNFGASLDQVRSYLLMQGAELEKREVSWNIRQGWDFVPSGTGTANLVLHFTPRLYFSSSDHLERIVLALNDGDGDRANVAVTAVHEQLLGRYGPPASESADCTATNLGGRQFECRAVWRAPNQIITLDWSYNGSTGNRKLQFDVAYAIVQNAF